MIYNNVCELIGKTPMVRLDSFGKAYGAKGRIIAKLEYFNPAGSVKDRVALSMIEDAEKRGLIKPGSIIIEPTSGNTGIGLACVCARRGYKAIIVMPDTMSIERRKLMGAYGAEIVLTDGALGMNGAIAKAKELSCQYENSIVAGQFENPANPDAHYRTTGPEIWEDCKGNIDIFVSGIGTGGTISGIGRYLKEKNPNIKIIGIEPASSPYLTQKIAGPHALQGIGAGFEPEILDKGVIDEVITITNEEAYEATRLICRTEGLLVGITSGAAALGAAKLLQREDFKGKTVVALLPDTGERYLSANVF